MNVIDQASGEGWALYNADCVEVARAMPEKSVDFAVYSPPFASLYTYGPSERDMGNVASDEEFFAQYSFLVRELYRVLRPGRLVSVHCKELVNYAGSSEDGMAGLRDFPGGVIACHKAAGFSYHSRTTLWRDPVVEMQKTKAHGLLYKQLRTDSTFSRMGMAEYVLTFRKWAEEGESEEISPVTHTRDTFTLEQWQRWASPVWTDVDHTDTLNVRAAREDKDEKHLCPMSLDVIRRCLCLWSNPGDVVFSPFAGVGSEGYAALKARRRFVGVELKASYYAQACRNLREAATVEQRTLFEEPREDRRETVEQALFAEFS